MTNKSRLGHYVSEVAPRSKQLLAFCVSHLPPTVRLPRPASAICCLSGKSFKGSGDTLWKFKANASMTKLVYPPDVITTTKNHCLLPSVRCYTPSVPVWYE